MPVISNGIVKNPDGTYTVPSFNGRREPSFVVIDVEAGQPLMVYGSNYIGVTTDITLTQTDFDATLVGVLGTVNQGNFYEAATFRYTSAPTGRILYTDSYMDIVPSPVNLIDVENLLAEWPIYQNIVNSLEGSNMNPTFTSLNVTTGRVGIGVTNPSQKVEVAGTVKASYFMGDGSMITGRPWASTLQDTFYVGPGNVAIGMTSTTGLRPPSMLTVGGGVSIGTSNIYHAAPTDGLLVNGSVGIGTTVPFIGAALDTYSGMTTCANLLIQTTFVNPSTPQTFTLSAATIPDYAVVFEFQGPTSSYVKGGIVYMNYSSFTGANQNWLLYTDLFGNILYPIVLNPSGGTLTFPGVPGGIISLRRDYTTSDITITVNELCFRPYANITDGYVGIGLGTSTPACSLDVSGLLKVRNSNYVETTYTGAGAIPVGGGMFDTGIGLYTSTGGGNILLNMSNQTGSGNSTASALYFIRRFYDNSVVWSSTASTVSTIMNLDGTGIITTFGVSALGTLTINLSGSCNYGWSATVTGSS